MRQGKLYKIWSKVPVDYYQSGIKNNLFQKIWHQNKIDSVCDVINSIDFSNCLDVGCASGHMFSEIAKRFPKAKYFGIDVYENAIEYAKKNYPKIEFKTASADNLPFRDNFFNLVIFYETIEHVENPIACLKEIKRVLKKGGILILAMDSGSILFKIVWFFG